MANGSSKLLSDNGATTKADGSSVLLDNGTTTKGLMVVLYFSQTMLLQQKGWW